MTSVEQRINIYHLVSQVIAYDVPGDLIEVGSYVGETAVLIAKILEGERRDRCVLHVYDAFSEPWKGGDSCARLRRNFEDHGLPLPEIHRGWFRDTMPKDLPPQIAFAHIDCGYGGDPEEHKRVLLEAMTHIYPRMPRGAICSIVDYCDHDVLPGTALVQPGVKPAFDEFMAGRPESVSVLYANEFGHAYFRKL